MNIIKSAIVLIVVLLLILINFLLVRRGIRKNLFKTGKYAIIALVLLISLFPTIFLSKYIYPFDRNVRFKLVEVVEADSNSLKRFGMEWFGRYKLLGSPGVDSRWNTNAIPNIRWPELNLNMYTYIVVIGRELLSLKYNVWEQQGPPIIDLGTSPKWGKVVLSDTVDYSKVYIYRIRRIYIDRNKLTRQ